MAARGRARPLQRPRAQHHQGGARREHHIRHVRDVQGAAQEARPELAHITRLLLILFTLPCLSFHFICVILNFMETTLTHLGSCYVRLIKTNRSLDYIYVGPLLLFSESEEL